MYSWEDFKEDVSDGVDALSNALEEGGEAIKEAGEDLLGDAEDAWNEGTEPIRNAWEDGHIVGAIIATFAAVGSIPVAVGGSIADFVTDVGVGVIAGATTKVVGVFVGTLAGIIVATVTGDADKGDTVADAIRDFNDALGDAVIFVSDVAGDIAQRLADITAHVLTVGARTLTCALYWVGDAIESGLNAVRRWTSDTPAPEDASKGFYAIKHFFVLMFENRSFDHVLGWFHGVNGLASGPAPYYNYSTSTGISYQASNLANQGLLIDTPHEYPDVQDQLKDYPSLAAGGPTVINGGFVMSYEGAIAAESDGDARAGSSPGVPMAAFNEKTLPVMYALAKEFVVCDQWHASVPGPTVPNRQFVHAATAGGMADSPNNVALGYQLIDGGFRYQHGTVYDRLDGKCMSWRIYAGDYPLAMSLRGIATDDAFSGWSRLRRMVDFRLEVLGATDDFPSYIFIEPNYSIQTSYKDGDSQHPLGKVNAGEKLLKEVYETLRASPIWESSALIVIYDEHGGFYDHVKPPAAPNPGDERRYESWSTSDEAKTFQFDRLGFRVPALIISPWVKKGAVDSTLYDHSSVIATLAHRFNFANLTERDRLANKFSNVFTRTLRTDARPTLPNPA
jgi:phospholipase C